MECPDCVTTELDITHNVHAGPGARVKRAECPRCRSVFTIAQVVIHKATAHGQGAHAVARQIQRGRVRVELVAQPLPDKRRGVSIAVV